MTPSPAAIEPVLRCSVIVPVFEHWDRVPALLSCLAAQTIGTESFELLLIDNGSSGVPDAPSLPPFARLLHCAEAGSYAARNVGIAQARAPVLAFTDADCEPEPDWLARALACLAERDAETLLAGAIAVMPRDPRAPNRWERYDMVMGLRQRHFVRRGYAATANLLVARALAQRLGGFDAARYSGGDADFCRRALLAGSSLHYCEGVVVRHPARDDWRQLAGKVRRIKGGQLRAGGMRRRAWYVFRSFVPPLWLWSYILRSRGLTVGQRLQVCGVQALLWLVEMAEALRLLAGGAPRRS